jgi:hypothetical protein
MMSEQAAASFLLSIKEMKNPTLQEIISTANIAPEELSQATEPSQQNQAVSLFANLGIAAFAGDEACIDFYHISAFAAGLVQQARKVAVEPVVRIDLRSSLMLAMLHGLDNLRIQTLELPITSIEK